MKGYTNNVNHGIERDNLEGKWQRTVLEISGKMQSICLSQYVKRFNLDSHVNVDFIELQFWII